MCFSNCPPEAYSPRLKRALFLVEWIKISQSKETSLSSPASHFLQQQKLSRRLNRAFHFFLVLDLVTLSITINCRNKCVSKQRQHPPHPIMRSLVACFHFSTHTLRIFWGFFSFILRSLDEKWKQIQTIEETHSLKHFAASLILQPPPPLPLPANLKFDKCFGELVDNRIHFAMATITAEQKTSLGSEWKYNQWKFVCLFIRFCFSFEDLSFPLFRPVAPRLREKKKFSCWELNTSKKLLNLFTKIIKFFDSSLRVFPAFVFLSLVGALSFARVKFGELLIGSPFRF